MATSDPRIQYAKTTDGMSIAYWAMGEGPPLVAMPATPFTHVQLEWEIATSRRWLEALMSGRRLLRYDGRGFGLSDRSATDFTLEAQCLDLDAVADALGLDSFPLIAMGDSGMIAIAYAATRPERISHLILWCAWGRRTDLADDARTRSLRTLIEQDWVIYTETAARVLLGWNEDDAARQFAAFYREAAEPEVILRTLDTVYASDATPYMSKVTCPTLVMHRPAMPAVSVEVARQMAAGIPGARLALFEGTSPAPFLGDMDAIVATIHEFLGDEAQPRLPQAHPPTSGLLIILFTDMVSSTPQRQRLGDAAAQDVLRAHNSIVREALRAHGGAEVKHTGDGIMTSFSTASSALECSVSVQRACAEHNKRAPEQLHVRIGLHAGEPIAEERDLFGTAVVMAERICGKGAGGEILVSDVVRGLVAGKGFAFEDRGETALKGFDEPVRLFELRYAP